LIRIAHERIAGSPQKYANHVYGQNEFGGTSVLFLSPVSFSKLGFPEDKKSSPLPHLTWRVLSLTPGIVFFGGGILAGVSWVIKRRMRVQAQEMKEHD
jgi:formate dehydrogenase iron-sulfur subunit